MFRFTLLFDVVPVAECPVEGGAAAPQVSGDGGLGFTVLGPPTGLLCLLRSQGAFAALVIAGLLRQVNDDPRRYP